MNFAGPRGPFPGQFNPGTPSIGRFRNPYQQSPPPNLGLSGHHGRGSHQREKAVTFMPNDIKVPKPPKQPDKPLPAYMRYSRKVWETVKTQHPEMKMWDIGKLIGEQWRNLPNDERQGFFAEYEVEKAEYQDAMKNYHNSNAYRDWLKAKEKAQSALQEQQMMEKMMGSAMPKEEPRFQLQQIDDDDEEAEFSAKHIASSRFQRNHRLVAEIFGEAIVPDIKTIVTRPRLENLKRQVQSLMQHQRKLENEIEDMEEKFIAKKKKIIDRNDEFEEKMNEIAGQPLPNTDISKDGENEVETPCDDQTNCQENQEEKMDVIVAKDENKERLAEKVEDIQTNERKERDNTGASEEQKDAIVTTEEKSPAKSEVMSPSTEVLSPTV